MMLASEFTAVVQRVCQAERLSEALTLLKAVDNDDIVAAAEALTGQFAMAEIAGEQRIYHVSFHPDEAGEPQECVEYIMNEGDDVIRFVAWFFDHMFSVKRKDTYQAAGKTYTQAARHSLPDA